MKEFSNEELVNLLISKVKEIKEEKQVSQELNVKLQENVIELEELTEMLKDAQRELRQQRDNLVDEVKKKADEVVRLERLSAIGELSARIAHDLRNPLSIIKNTLEMLKLKNIASMDEKTKMQWERVERALSRITHQVNDVLDFVKMTPIKKSNNSISKILENAIERINIPKKITVKISRSNIIIPCDAERLEIVFVNLLTNSIQAIGDKLGKITFKISDDPSDNDFILIELKDTGPGIPLDIRPKIFDPLFTTRQIGTGLGLPSCKNIIEKHGGTINIKNTKGKGATFLIKLPKKTEWERIPQESKKQKVKVTT